MALISIFSLKSVKVFSINPIALDREIILSTDLSFFDIKIPLPLVRLPISSLLNICIYMPCVIYFIFDILSSDVSVICTRSSSNTPLYFLDAWISKE